MTAPATLIIGNKNYSSWSLRAWLVLRHFEVPFEEHRLSLDTDAFQREVGNYSPTRRVPALIHGAVTVWDSLAIAEYANETWLGGRGWPPDAEARAVARAVSAEMHSGMQALRDACPMDLTREAPIGSLPEPAGRDVARVLALWRDCRRRYGVGGAFLFGAFGIADAFYAPMATRFRSYALLCGEEEQRYVEALYALPAMRQWCAEAAQETERIDPYAS
jgi:glutathione S-transferase